MNWSALRSNKIVGRLACHKISQKTNKRHLTLLILEKRNCLFKFWDNLQAGQSAYNFITPLVVGRTLLLRTWVIMSLKFGLFEKYT